MNNFYVHWWKSKVFCKVMEASRASTPVWVHLRCVLQAETPGWTRRPRGGFADAFRRRFGLGRDKETVQQSTLHIDSFICYHPQKPSKFPFQGKWSIYCPRGKCTLWVLGWELHFKLIHATKSKLNPSFGVSEVRIFLQMWFSFGSSGKIDQRN